MATLLLKTKLYIPPSRPNLVPRPRLIERLNEGLHRKLTLISVPAGFGKTTLLSEWISQRKQAQMAASIAKVCEELPDEPGRPRNGPEWHDGKQRVHSVRELH